MQDWFRNSKMKPFYITTTLPYVNAELHMGHALEFIRADVIARYRILVGDDVFFNSGTDEHGSKIFKKAQEEGIEVKKFVDDNVKKFYESVTLFGLTKDIHFIRTSDVRHVDAAKAFWLRVKERGFIYKKNYQTKYCIGCETEKTDSELVDGKCPEHQNSTIEFIDEENYFFKFSEFQKPLLEFYKNHSKFVIPDFRFNELRMFVERGLDDFSISRLKSKMPWGIEVPGDESHVMYVWFDALVSYIANIGWPTDEKTFTKYWKEGTPTQYCGKDNTRFQGAMWQAMLMAAGLSNSYQIVVNGHITAEGGLKMSKSLGNVVDPKILAQEYGTDALRFFLLKEISSFEDSPFTIERFKDSYNAHLANGLGNLVSRIM
ncbi:MAG: methionine--tRNA ligase, partial [Candidatus Taylorbacteria bacterium]|nr:methionine--tRNA ligase [Candidatus Taylorbacteria bacterium]